MEQIKLVFYRNLYNQLKNMIDWEKISTLQLSNSPKYIIKLMKTLTSSLN